MFSPWYHWSGRGDPEDHCCINFATYGKGGVFTMTDRGRDALALSPNKFSAGPSSVIWRDGSLHFEIDERAAPPQFGQVRARVKVTPSAVTRAELPLTPDGAHVWRPFAPVARIEVDMARRGWTWSGHGYFDANFGIRPLEADFDTWTWGRFPTRTGALCFYDAMRRDGTRASHAIEAQRDGATREVPLPEEQAFSRTLWRLPRTTRSDGAAPRQVQPMLDAPFYARSMVETTIGEDRVMGVHEALDLRRYGNPLIKPMIALRVPRRKRWQA